MLPALKLIAPALLSTTVSAVPAPPLIALFRTAPSLIASVSSPPHRSMVPVPDTVPDTVIVSACAPQPKLPSTFSVAPLPTTVFSALPAVATTLAPAADVQRAAQHFDFLQIGRRRGR